MAEILGTAASVIQVAEAGFSLATTLYNYAKSVKSAEKEIKKIARDVKLTAKVLQRTHEQLQHDQDAQTCTEEAIHDLEDVLDGCREAFQEVDDALTKSMKTGADGKTTISMAEKLKWPLRSNKLEVLRANLEKLKTTLLLMLSVLAYGSKISQSRAGAAEVKVELTLEKLQIQNLVQAKDEATQRYEELSKAFSRLETRINESAKSNSSSTGLGSFSKEPADSSNSASMVGRTTTAMFTIAGSNMPPVEPRTEDRKTPDMVHSEHAVYIGLGVCASAVSRLTTSIDAATKKWQTDQVFEHHAILNSFQSTSQAVNTLMFHSRAASARPANAGPQPSSLPAPQHSAHQDYQLQLALLEEQNKKRLLAARTTQDSAASRDEEPFKSSPNMGSGQAMGIDVSRSSSNAESQVSSPRPNRLAGASSRGAQYNHAIPMLIEPIAPPDEPDMMGGASQVPPQADYIPQALLQQYGELRQLEQALQQQAYSPPQALVQRQQQALQRQQHAAQQQAQQHHYARRSSPTVYLSGTPSDSMPQQGHQIGLSRQKTMHPRGWSGDISGDQSDSSNHDDDIGDIMQNMPTGTAGPATNGSSQDRETFESAEDSSQATPSKKRTTSGRLTYRKQRIKCDEQCPSCSDCAKNKRQCEGYSQRAVYNVTDAYSSDSDAEAVQGLAIMRMAEEDESRRQSSGSQMRSNGLGSQRDYRQQQTDASDSDEMAGVDMTSFGGGYDVPYTYPDHAHAELYGTDEQNVARRGSYEAPTSRYSSTPILIKPPSPGIEDDDEAEEDQSDSDGDDDVVLDLLRRWIKVERPQRSHDMLEDDADQYAQVRLPDLDMGL